MADLDDKKALGLGDTEADIQVGVQSLVDVVAPHESYEGAHLYDPGATWTPQEEARVVRKADIYLLSWLCVMV